VDPYLSDFEQRVYLSETEIQGSHAKRALAAMKAALEGRRSGGGFELHKEVFRNAHSFLTHASNISLLFWPSVPGRKTTETAYEYGRRLNKLDRVRRAEHLRAIFRHVSLERLKDRTLRNHLEHYDERLDDWRKDHHGMLADTIASPGSVVGIRPTDAMRWLDPSTLRFSFRGAEFDLVPLAEEIEAVRAFAEEQAGLPNKGRA
jgi:hypothetical protein